MPTGIVYDQTGEFATAQQDGPLVPWRDNDTQSMLYERTLWHRESLWTPTARDTLLRAPVAATALVTGRSYIIVTVGTTDFMAIGAAANTVGVIFTASAAGTGTGTAGEAIFLVEETKPSPIGADLLEWTQTFAAIPGSRIEALSYVHEEQEGDNEDGIEVLKRRSKVVTAYDEIDYFLTGDPRSIPILSAGGMTSSRGKIFGSGYIFRSSYLAAEDSTISRWRGNIWERVTKMVNDPGSSLPRLLFVP